MKKRLFVGVDLPDWIKKKVESEIVKINFGDHARFIAGKNLHITLSFLGAQDDGEIPKITDAVRETAENFKPPEIVFDRFELGPPGRTPRMIWLTTSEKTSQILLEIKEFLEKAMAEKGIKFAQESRKFNGHVTIARFPVAQPRKKTESPFEVRFEPESIDLFESVLKRSGAEYFKMGNWDFLQ